MTISDVIIVAVVGGIVSIFTTMLATSLQGYKWRNGESGKVHADAAQSLTDTSLAIVTEMRKDIEALRLELAEVKAENVKLQVELNELRQNNHDLRDWAERLVHQVRSLGHEPVKIRVTVNQ